MRNELRADRPQTDLQNALVDDVLPPLAETLYRVAANLVVIESGKTPTQHQLQAIVEPCLSAALNEIIEELQKRCNKHYSSGQSERIRQWLREQLIRPI